MDNYNNNMNPNYNQGNMYNAYNGGNYYMPGNNNHYGRKNKSNLGLGILIGVLVGAVAVLAFVVLIVTAVVTSGIISIDESGTLYIQSYEINDEDGIGTSVEKKLNALDSLLDNFYFKDVSDAEAADEIFKAYVDAYGDKYTVYYTPEEYKALMESTTGKYCGIGAVCSKNQDGTVLIVEPYEYAPAYKAGIRAGDCITTIDGKDVTSMTLESATALIKGDKGTNVTLQVRRDGEIKTFTVTRDTFEVQTVSYRMMEDNIAYLEISQFDDVTTQQFKDALTALNNQGMKGLVIDIRDNPGGLLSGVVEILDEIVPNGMIVYTEDKEGNRREYKGTNNKELSIPIAVLVNGNSASAAEIFAGVMQDYDKGEIIGTQTFGKGIVQTIQPLSDGSAVKFTIAKYYTAKGQDIHGKGVTPDQVVELPADATSDVQLDAAVKWVKEKLN